MKLAARVGRIVPSPTLSITATAKSMAAQGIDVIDFASGEPDFDTPEPVKAAAEAAIRAGFTKYTPSSGIDEGSATTVCTRGASPVPRPGPARGPGRSIRSISGDRQRGGRRVSLLHWPNNWSSPAAPNIHSTTWRRPCLKRAMN